MHDKRAAERVRRELPIRLFQVLLCLAVFSAGCGRLKPVNLINADTHVHSPRVLVFFADGVNRQVFRQMLHSGNLENIDRFLVRRGVSVENAITCAPSITYAITASFLTGKVPGHHGILGNRFFDRDRLILADFNTIATYQNAEQYYYQSPTLFEILDDKYSVSIQTALRRGVYRNIDNWASSGIRWYFHQIPEIDCLVAEQFNLISKEARRAGRWPELIWAYMPATDEMGHRYGPDSKPYRHALQNMDEQIGRICKALQASGLLDDTYLFFVTDHGMPPCPKNNYWEIAKALKLRFHWRIAETGPDARTEYSRRRNEYANADAVVVNGGNRRVFIYLRNGSDWNPLASREQIEPVTAYLAQQQSVCLSAYRIDDNQVMLQNRLGRALLQRQNPLDNTILDLKQYSYRVIDGTDPLGYTSSSCASALADGEFHTGKAWLEATANMEYPDLPVQLIEMFDSRRAGDIAVFAASGWDFARENVAGHGSVLAEDMAVPLLVAGPGIPNGTIDTARTVDLAPTIVDMLDPARRALYPMDGKSILPELRSAK